MRDRTIIVFFGVVTLALAITLIGLVASNFVTVTHIDNRISQPQPLPPISINVSLPPISINVTCNSDAERDLDFDDFSGAAFSGSDRRPANTSWAGVLFMPTTDVYALENCSSSTTRVHYTCGVALVDVNSIGISSTLQRRVLLTAAHCLEGPSFPIHVTFKDDPAMVTDTSCLRPRFPVSFGPPSADPSNWFTASTPAQRIVSFEGPFGTGYGIGINKFDFALIVLDSAVPSSVVPVLATVPDWRTARSRTLSPRTFSRVGTVGYGTVTWGQISNGRLLGQPVNIVGERRALYIEQDTSSVQSWSLTSRMVVAAGDQLLCNGDSGSAAIDLDEGTNHVVRATVFGGDANCRAINTWNRIDTPEYAEWIASVRASVNALA